jgi:hypothetical protein
VPEAVIRNKGITAFLFLAGAGWNLKEICNDELRF